MNVKQLLASLQGLAGVIEAAGAKKHASDLKSLEQIFDGQEDLEVGVALAELEKLLGDDKQRMRDEYLNRLVAAKTDEASFKAVHIEIERDQRVSKEDADAIAHSYTGGRRKWASRKASIEAIEKKFVERAYQESKMRIVERYKIG